MASNDLGLRSGVVGGDLLIVETRNHKKRDQTGAAIHMIDNSINEQQEANTDQHSLASEGKSKIIRLKKTEVDYKLDDLKYKVYVEGKFLDLEEELFLGRLVQKGIRDDAAVIDVKRYHMAAEMLSHANIRLVKKWSYNIYKQYPTGTTMEDCYAAGMAGMARAIRTYDPSKGFKFSTYATQWIRHYVQRLGHKIARPATMPGPRVFAIAEINKEINKLKADGIDVTPDKMDEILERNGLDRAEYRKAVLFNTAAKSIDQPVSDDDESMMAERIQSSEVEMSTLGESSIMSLDDVIYRQNASEQLEQAMSELNDVQRRIIELMYLDPQPMSKTGELHRSMASIRRQLGISKTEGEKELKNAMSSLRKSLKSMGYERGDREN